MLLGIARHINLKRKTSPNTMHAILGPTETDPLAQMLGTGFCRFHSPLGIKGLARENPGKLELLAVDATHPGTGQFREFVKQLKNCYPVICVWFDWNPLVGPMLARYGFTKHSEIDSRGETLEGWKYE